MHQPDVLGLLGIDGLAGHGQPPGPVRTDQPGEAADAARAGDDGDVGHLGEAPDASFDREAEVAGHRQFDADTDAGGLGRQDHRLLDLLDLIEDFVVRLAAVLAAHVGTPHDAVGALPDVGAQVEEVEARGEVAALGGDHRTRQASSSPRSRTTSPRNTPNMVGVTALRSSRVKVTVMTPSASSRHASSAVASLMA